MSEFQPDSDSAGTSAQGWRLRLVFFLFAILAHIAFLLLRFDWGSRLSTPRVEIQQIDPLKLDTIRKHWEKNIPKSLLIDKDPSPPPLPRKQEAPADARYFSDRNIRVKKEQRARNTSVLPHSGQPPASRKSRTKTQVPDDPLPKMGNLGIPFDLTSNKERQQSPDSVPARGQNLLEKDLPEGSENLLNAQESVFYSFYARLYEAIGPVWQSLVREASPGRRLQQGDYSTLVDVVFNAQGDLLEVRLMRGSGVDAFDRAVEQAWRKIAKFPNPPRGLLDEHGTVHTGWTFSVQVGNGFGLRYFPPERNY